MSVASGGLQANGNSYAPDISGDGRSMVFDSDATTLVSGDTNGAADVFSARWAAPPRRRA